MLQLVLEIQNGGIQRTEVELNVNEADKDKNKIEGRVGCDHETIAIEQE
jgi:NifB/MoaA-like Fe-S oxidoreductase